MTAHLTRWLVVTLVVGLGSWVSTLLPTLASVNSMPFERPGAVGEWIALRTADVRVTGIDTAKTVQFQYHELTTSQLWLVVHLEIVPATEPLSPPPLILRDSHGRSFGDDYLLPSTCAMTQPGLVTACSQVLELPPDALVGAKVWLQGFANAAHGPDDVAVVDLAIDEALAAQLAAATAPVAVPGATVLGKP